MQWVLEGETTPQEIKEFMNKNPLRSRGHEFWVKASDKFLEKQTPILDNDEGKNERIELLFAVMVLKDEDGIIEMYNNIHNVNIVEKVGNQFNNRNGFCSMYINICILREALRKMTDNDDLRISILKTIGGMWNNIGNWKEKTEQAPKSKRDDKEE